MAIKRHFGRAIGPNPVIAQGTYTIATSVAIQLLNVGSGIMLARLLGPSGRGQLAALLLWPFLLVNLTATGMADATTYFIAKAPERSNRVIGTSLFLALAQSAIYVGLALPLLPVLLDRYGDSVVEASRLYLAWIPLYVLWFTGNAVLLARGEVKAFNVARLTVIASTVAGLVILFVGHVANLQYIALVYVLANGITLAVILGELAKRRWLHWRPAAGVAMPLWKYGMKASVMTMSGMTNERGDQALIAVFLPAYALGLYAIAVTVASPVIVLVGSLSSLALPAVAGAATNDQQKEVLSRFVRVTLVISIASAVVMAAAAGPLIRLFFGVAFAPAVDSARILMAAAVAFSLNLVLSAGLKAFNRPLVPGVAQIIANVITVVFLFALVPRIGILGAAITSLFAYVISATYMLLAVRRQGLPLAHLLLPSREDTVWLVKRLRSRPDMGLRISPGPDAGDPPRPDIGLRISPRPDAGDP